MLRTLSYRCLDTWDRIYRRYHRLEPVGPLFFVGSKDYVGVERCFADGTWLRRGDRLGTLHFNNARIASLNNEPGKHQTAWRFTRLLRESLHALAHFSTSPMGLPVAVFHGTTWMQVHGLKVGFTIEPLPASWRTHLLGLHFRMLKACFAPASFRRSSAEIVPRSFWITRGELQKNFGRQAPR